MSTRHPPNATTSARRARSRHANRTASNMTAPTYAPGAEPNASGQVAHTPFVASGRSLMCAVERTGCPERVVAAVQARRADEREARDQDGEARERHRDQEQAGASGSRPTGDLPAADGRHRRRDQERRQQQRAHHQPVAHVRARHLGPRERRRARATPGGATIDRRADTPTPPPARSSSSRGSPRTATRSPCPRSTSASPGRGHRPSRPAATCDSLRRNQKRPSPASSGLSTISARIAAPGDNIENRSIGGTYSQPLCGSAANR